MDFFDPQKQKQHSVRLAIGYAIIGVALVLATTVLLYHAYGFGLDKDGRIIQNGLVFAGSRPKDADIYINDKKYKNTTDTRMSLPSGQYVMELRRDGYRDWKRALTVEGGSLGRFTYPLLFPTTLHTTGVTDYGSVPMLSTQSPDLRWLMVARAEQDSFDIYDLSDRTPAPQSVELSSDMLAAASTPTAWTAVAWAQDNRHVLLKRSYKINGQAGAEYILFDRESPELSQNLSVKWGFTPTRVELRNKAHDQYYLYDKNSAQLFTASLKNTVPQPYIGGVLAFTVERDVVAYVTTEDADTGKALIRLKQGDKSAQTVRQVSADAGYLLDMATYDGDLYLAAGATNEDRVFLFRNPLSMLKSAPGQILVPIHILKTPAIPTFVAFSNNQRFVIVESLNKFAVYDAETDRGYAYQVTVPLDQPQTHATWLDGFRLGYVSGGKTTVFDYDGTNLQYLSPSSTAHRSFFDQSYKFMYSINEQSLVRIALLTPDDQN